MEAVPRECLAICWVSALAGGLAAILIAGSRTHITRGMPRSRRLPRVAPRVRSSATPSTSSSRNPPGTRCSPPSDRACAAEPSSCSRCRSDDSRQISSFAVAGLMIDHKRLPRWLWFDRAAVGTDTCVSLGHRLLHRDGAAQRTASTTLANSTSNPSPVVLTMRPRCSAIFGSTSSRRSALRHSRVPHPPRHAVARDRPGCQEILGRIHGDLGETRSRSIPR
jgi:hypothetical protein